MSSSKVIVITGGSRGIGAKTALEAARRGFGVILTYNANPDAAHALVRDIEARGGKAVALRLDVAVASSFSAFRIEVEQALAAIWNTTQLAGLVNNAGYGLFGEFLQQPLPKLLDMLQLNILTLTELTHLFAADMVHRGHGGILLVASLGGYQSTPLYAAYCASKGYVLQFGEALHEELKPRGVTVTVVSPGISATQFLSVSGQQPTLYQRIAMMQSRPVAKIGLAALASGRASIVPGWLNTLSAWAFRMAPRAVVRKVTHQLMRN